jgi:hypothetical protein
MEIVPGIHRIESDLGVRFMCQYLLVGEDRTILIDTGLAGTPEEVMIPYLEELGLRLEDVEEVIVSHADLDHCEVNRALRERNPRLRFSCGESDRPYVENNRVVLAEIYGWSEPYGFGPDERAKASILEDLGGASSMDAGLRGGETLRLGSAWRVEILHLPGHTPGAPRDLGPEERGGDHHRRRAGDRHLRPRREPPDPAALLRRPPVPGHDPQTPGAAPGAPPHRPLPAHAGPGSPRLPRPLPRLHGAGPRVVSEGVEGGTTDLWELTKRAVAPLGPYPEFGHELGAGVRAHMAVL